MSKRIMIQCRTSVKRDAVKRTSINGVEHIIVSSATLPDNVVMNGGLYPAEEIEKSFQSLELTLAPIEHPTNTQGDFISATDPEAIHKFHAGAFNMNVRRENGRVMIDKFINVQEALKTERGKRLLDRIDELENNSDPRPIHTSVGVFLFPEELEEVQTNEDGDEFGWIAREMVFDHDAILLDSVGAAQPHQGVGVAVNREGQEFQVNDFTLSDDDDIIIRVVGNQSFSDVHKAVGEALERSAIDANWIEELFTDRVIFWSDDLLFEVPYVTDDQGIATIVGVPLPVEREVTFTPKTNSEGDNMKELILNALKQAGIATDGLTDDQLFSAYNSLQAKPSDSNGDNANDDQGIAEVVANALKPVVAQMNSIEEKMNQLTTEETDRLAEVVANSDKYPGIDADAAKKLGLETLKEMVGNCVPAFGVNPVVNAGGRVSDDHKAPTEMPK